MKEICLVFEAFPVFVFLSPDITNCYKLFTGSNCIFEPSTMHSTPRLTRQMPQHEPRSEPDLTLLWNILTWFRCGENCPRAPGLSVRSLGGKNRLMHPLLSDSQKKQETYEAKLLSRTQQLTQIKDFKDHGDVAVWDQWEDFKWRLC